MRHLWQAILKILKVVAFWVIALLIGIIPAFCFVFVLSLVLWFFEIEVSATAGNIIMVILAACMGGEKLADMLDIKFPSRRR